MGPMPAPMSVGHKERFIYTPLKQETTGSSRTEVEDFKTEPPDDP